MQTALDNFVFPKASKKVYFYLVNGINYCHLPRLDKTNPKSYITKAAYYPLHLTAILSQNIDKALFGDCDIIVRHSLKDLWNTDLGTYSVGVVPDVGEGVIDKYNRLRYPPPKGYFNSGVYLINLKKCRDEHVIEKFVEFMQKHSNWLKLHDQDVLNKVFCDDKLILPITYNFHEGFLWNDIFYDYWKYEKQVLAARKDPIVIHYTDSKPWIEGCDHPFKYEFFKYQENTIWAHTPLIKKEHTHRTSKIIGDAIKRFLRLIGILSPLPTYSPKYIDIEKYD